MKTKFEREDRYLVIKRSDLARLCIDDVEDVYAATETIEADRKKLGKKPLQCVVIESDWPEYETVWAMIQARVEGRIIEPEQSASGDGEVPPTTTAEKVSFIVAAVESVMGMGRSHLSASVEANNILVDDEESFSTLVTIDIKPLEGDSPTIACQSTVQVDIVDGEAVLIWGEDDEVSLTTGNLYADLFFHSLPQADSELASVSDATHAQLYRRLRTLGCVPNITPKIDPDDSLTYDALDKFLADDIAHVPSRGEVR